ncbi:MAG: RNA polymerase sigma factor [Acidobacteriota bacterium]
MAAYQAGKMAAFENIYRRLAPDLRRYLISLTRNRPRAEDLLQETFLQIHRSRHTYSPPRPMAPWAFGIARHVYLMDCRAWARRRRLEIEPVEDLPEVPVPAFGEGVADQDLLRRAVSHLAADRREPLLLHHIWGFSFKEIAGILGIREGAAKVRAHRARKQLESLLKQTSSTAGRNQSRADDQEKKDESGLKP